MNGLMDMIVDFYNKNKELSIAIAGALVGIIGTWVFNKLGPWVLNLLRSMLDILGKLIGGHFAYAGIRRKYLNWVVLQNQDLNLTGVIATGEKPKLEEVFISLRVMDEDKDAQKDDVSQDLRKGWFVRVISKFSPVSWGNLLAKLSSKKEDKTLDPGQLSLFVKNPLWRFEQFINRPTINLFFGLMLAAIIFVGIPVYGLLIASNINSWLAGLGAGIWILMISVMVIIEIDTFKWKDLDEWFTVIFFIILPILILGYSIKAKIIDGHQSPLAILIGIGIAALFVALGTSADKITLSSREVSAMEVGKLLDSSDYIAILGKPVSTSRISYHG